MTVSSLYTKSDNSSWQLSAGYTELNPDPGEGLKYDKLFDVNVRTH